MDDQDNELMLKFKEGDISAFEELLKKYEKSILNLVYHFLGNSNDAEDLTQEVFLRVYRARETWQPKAKFSTWLYRITANLCFNWRRKKTPLSLEDLSILPSTTNGSSENTEIKKEIQKALLSLPKNQRLALILCHYEDKSYQEIGELLGCSVSSVKSLIFRARQNLKTKLKHLI
ncbi:MAG TPA: RNA polymerase subunit sigma [Elusimicrobia bacterium]|jgi:RNA polymerase sigma-70 factor (ECF subfamily)|nr:RNA polymerase subunit sigma [Elusimicrobiota bacterium]